MISLRFLCSLWTISWLCAFLFLNLCQVHSYLFVSFLVIASSSQISGIQNHVLLIWATWRLILCGYFLSCPNKFETCPGFTLSAYLFSFSSSSLCISCRFFTVSYWEEGPSSIYCGLRFLFCWRNRTWCYSCIVWNVSSLVSSFQDFHSISISGKCSFFISCWNYLIYIKETPYIRNSSCYWGNDNNNISSFNFA